MELTLCQRVGRIDTAFELWMELTLCQSVGGIDIVSECGWN